MIQDPNSLDQELKDGLKPNLENKDLGTEKKDTLNPLENADSTIDYQKKFSESSKEALKLLDEKKVLEAKLAEFEKGSSKVVIPENKVTENLYPGFEELDPEAQENLIKYTNLVTERAKGEILKDPAIAFAKSQYNEKRFDTALNNLVQEFPDLKGQKDEFKLKYFKGNAVPENIDDILKDLAKIHLFDKAKEIGADEEKARKDRIDTERVVAGPKDKQIKRTLEDWQKIAQDDPMKFASLSKEYNEDLKSGNI